MDLSVLQSTVSPERDERVDFATGMLGHPDVGLPAVHQGHPVHLTAQGESGVAVVAGGRRDLSGTRRLVGCRLVCLGDRGVRRYLSDADR